ncbi:hypothetical protein [Candidatus Odyssella acanthamoebae]|uniref:Uncharacterized protein n=1 Tax=Candidatus Odyssella acanthamoebae TaxID=91604 RepID=A0A077AZV5_9PROT|nr:hypothetical protein [Candidatus Paracaedibacter acanthamoebae]AIK97238.1 hypothetical protein ID47_11610 [Candidatus Paracaedibacter acanthamoebae]
MSDFSVLQKGNIYFFYRPKVQHSYAHSIDDVQGLLLVFKPTDLNKYIILRVGKKRLPEATSYFAFVEKVCSTIEELKAQFKGEHYKTATEGERKMSAAQCVGEGKYLFLGHEQHTHLCFQLTDFEETNTLQKEFHLTAQADYLISVKNPHTSSPTGAGLPRQEKANYPLNLQNNFDDYRFIPLISPEYLNYEGAEFIIIGKDKSDIEEDNPKIQECLHNITDDDLHQNFNQIENPDKEVVKILGEDS